MWCEFGNPNCGPGPMRGLCAPCARKYYTTYRKAEDLRAMKRENAFQSALTKLGLAADGWYSVRQSPDSYDLSVLDAAEKAAIMGEW